MNVATSSLEPWHVRAANDFAKAFKTKKREGSVDFTTRTNAGRPAVASNLRRGFTSVVVDYAARANIGSGSAVIVFTNRGSLPRNLTGSNSRVPRGVARDPEHAAVFLIPPHDSSQNHTLVARVFTPGVHFASNHPTLTDTKLEVVLAAQQAIHKTFDNLGMYRNRLGG